MNTVDKGLSVVPIQLHTRSHEEMESKPLPGPSAVICMADSAEQLAIIQDAPNVVARLDLVFHDTSEPFQIVQPPTEDHARQILQFAREQNGVPHLVIQCQVGVGRSHAVLAALVKISGGDNKPILRHGTYNRSLYRKLMTAAGHSLPAEPLVSLSVRIKYAPDRIEGFLLSMKRQRYDNWEIVAFTDGPNPGAVEVVKHFSDKRVRMIETPKAMGRWGYPYRQMGMDACRGEFIGLSNDDNYYVPGYIEQMVNALENADLALSPFLHSHHAWKQCPAGTDLGSWMARASLVRQIPWTGVNFTSDRHYIEKLVALANGRVAVLDRPLFIHN